MQTPKNDLTRAAAYRRARAEIGNREYVARLLGVTATTLYNRENGRVPITSEAEFALAKLQSDRIKTNRCDEAESQRREELWSGFQATKPVDKYLDFARLVFARMWARLEAKNTEDAISFFELVEEQLKTQTQTTENNAS